MKFLLDTNAVIAILLGKQTVVGRLKQHRPSEAGIPSIVLHELFFGAFKSSKVEANLARIDALQLEILDFDREDARHAGAVRPHLSSAGTPIGPYDALIAGQALARSMVLITHNTRVFQRVPDLRVEDWE